MTPDCFAASAVTAVNVSRRRTGSSTPLFIVIIRNERCCLTFSISGSRGQSQVVAMGPSRSPGNCTFLCKQAKNSSPTEKVNRPSSSHLTAETVLPLMHVSAICFSNESMVNDSRSSKTKLPIGSPGPKLAPGESVFFFQNISEPSSHCTGWTRALAHLTAVSDGNLAPDLAITIPH